MEESDVVDGMNIRRIAECKIKICMNETCTKKKKTTNEPKNNATKNPSHRNCI